MHIHQPVLAEFALGPAACFELLRRAGETRTDVVGQILHVRAEFRAIGLELTQNFFIHFRDGVGLGRLRLCR